MLVVKPSFGCSTNLIYSKVKYFSKPKYNSPKQSLFNTKNIVNSKNDLEQIVFKIYPKLKKLKLFLIKLIWSIKLFFHKIIFQIIIFSEHKIIFSNNYFFRA